MSVRETKQALRALYEGRIWDGFDKVHYSKFLVDLDGTKTAVQVTSCVSKYFTFLYRCHGQALIDLVLQAFTPAEWAINGVLINPTAIPADKDLEYYVICDGSVKTVQESPVRANYYGDVRLTIRKGIAAVKDTHYPVDVYGDKTYLSTKAPTTVYAHDSAEISIGGCARAILYDRVSADAFDRAFVESRGSKTKIEAYGTAQVYVAEGGVELIMRDTARAVVCSKEIWGEQTVSVDIYDECVLYAKELDSVLVDRHVHPQADYTLGLVLDGESIHIDPERMRDILLPRYKEAAVPSGDGIEEPIDFAVLKKDVLQYMPVSLHELINRTTDERELCMLITPYLPTRVELGLTGDFLQRHFTKQTLTDAQIHTNGNKDCFSYWEKAKGKHYFFTDEVVDLRSYTDHVYGFGNALLLSNKNTCEVRVGQSANAIVWGKGRASGLGHGTIVGLQSSSVNAMNHTWVIVTESSRCDASDLAHVEAHDDAVVNAKDRTTAVLHDHSSATVDGHTRTLAISNGKVCVTGCAEVAFPVNDQEVKPDIKVLSNEATLRGLQSKEAVDEYRDSLRKGVSIERKKTTGLGQ